MMLAFFFVLCLIAAIVGWTAQGLSSNPNDDTGHKIAIRALLLAAICLGVILLGGCSAGRAIIDACRDGLCR